MSLSFSVLIANTPFSTLTDFPLFTFTFSVRNSEHFTFTTAPSSIISEYQYFTFTLIIDCYRPLSHTFWLPILFTFEVRDWRHFSFSKYQYFTFSNDLWSIQTKSQLTHVLHSLTTLCQNISSSLSLPIRESGLDQLVWHFLSDNNNEEHLQWAAWMGESTYIYLVIVRRTGESESRVSWHVLYRVARPVTMRSNA